MSKESHNDLLFLNLLSYCLTGLRSGLALSVLTNLVLLPGVAKAQTVSEPTQALDTPTPPANEAEQRGDRTHRTNSTNTTEVKTREVEWNVPWIAAGTAPTEPQNPQIEQQPPAPQPAIVPKIREAAETENYSNSDTWIALASEAEETEAENKKTPWIARTLADEIPASDNAEAPPIAIESAVELAIGLPQQEVKKRPAPWISLTPVELTESNTESEKSIQ